MPQPPQPPVDNDHVAPGCQQFERRTHKVKKLAPGTRVYLSGDTTPMLTVGPVEVYPEPELEARFEAAHG